MEFQSRYWTSLDVKSFGKMLSKTQLSHKYYFFPVIVDAIIRGEKDISFREVAERMIAEAWYPVLEHHVHLGLFKNKKPNDWIEQSVNYIQAKLQVESDINKEQLIKQIRKLRNQGDDTIDDCFEMITRYAPYRLLSPFLSAQEADFQVEDRIFNKIHEANTREALPYIIDRNSAETLDRKIIFDQAWSKFIQDNGVEILGWINNERLNYLQKRNPEMPGLIFKMKPIKRDRKLKYVRNLWKELLKVESFKDIFSGEDVDINDFEIDHFIPWSYVACDELWNLSPIHKSVNIDKSNYLVPEEYIHAFVNQHEKMYEIILREKKRKLADPLYSSTLLDAFYNCLDRHVWAVWAGEELYIDNTKSFSTILYNNLKNLYDSALNQGYEEWIMHKERWKVIKHTEKGKEGNVVETDG